ncbi:MAG: hypothetical protein D6714_19235 [Bacteroidetes bacterium]|nr:MAG: hypothetical protein D6714_19235 [Bacteroidota bacterium]
MKDTSAFFITCFIIESMHSLPDFQMTVPKQKNNVGELLYKGFVSNNLQALAIVDESLRFITANAAFCTILGLPGENHLNRFHVSVLPFSKDPQFNALLDELVTRKLEKFEMETTLAGTSGEAVRYLKIRVAGIFEGDVFTGGMLVLEDVTHIRKKVEMLEQTIKELRLKKQNLKNYIDSGLQIENFAYLASHDLKEPLRMIGNFSQLLEKKYTHILDDTGQEYLNFILGGVRNMNLFINDLLDYAHLDRMPHMTEEINVRMLCELVFSEQKTNMELPDAQLFFGPAFPSKIYGSKAKIKSLFTHLISNGLKFRKPGQAPVLKISAWETDKFWEFKVEDNGIGIPKEFYDKVFLLFKRLHLRNEFSGSGIGLALCKKIVEQHGGEIWVKSEPGHGSAFYFTLEKSTA